MFDQTAGRTPQRDQEMTTMDCKFTIVIPTLAVRPKELERAIASLLEQNGGGVVPLVVVNGDRYDPELVEHLRQRRDIRFHYLEEGNLPKAIAYGRGKVDTSYFGFLDDDDVYLPDALAKRYCPFEMNPEVDVVVGNGWRESAGKKELIWTDITDIEADPAASVLDANWLASCGGLFKTDTVGTECFSAEIRYLEWTYLAFYLALTRRISFVSEPTFVVHDSPGSLSDSDAYVDGHSKVLNRMLELEMPRSLRNKLYNKLSDVYHSQSSHYLRRGVISAAWKCHLRSMVGIHGFLRYGLYTRHLLTLMRPRNDP